MNVVLSLQITGNFFDVLGVRPELGQALTGDHEQRGNQNWVWLSHGGWVKLLGSAPVENRVVWINSTPFQIAGVMPAWFDFPQAGESADIYIPLNREDFWKTRGAGGLGAIARMRPGVTMRRLQAELDARSKELAGQFAENARSES